MWNVFQLDNSPQETYWHRIEQLKVIVRPTSIKKTHTF